MGERPSPWEHETGSSIAARKPRSYDAVILNSSFDPSEVSTLKPDPRSEEKRQESTLKSLAACAELLKDGGLLFVYGLPRTLPEYAVYLEKMLDDQSAFLFKYWIAMEFRPLKLDRPLPNSHIGMLMYLKTKPGRNPSPFPFNNRDVRIPHRCCKACGENVRDWGGKKHLMNGKGSAVSDVWDFSNIAFEDAGKIPAECLERVHALVKREGLKMLVVYDEDVEVKPLPDSHLTNDRIGRPALESQVIQTNSFEYMRELSERYPDGVFDLAFADPPYNLEKDYASYEDAKEDDRYISWCNEWLSLMAEVVRPGGSLFVLNLPKWAVHHAKHLNGLLDFQHWIAWDSLSSPAGKLMPAHYALLYYTKPGGPITSNYEAIASIDSREYCLRGGCVSGRKEKGDDSKELLSDVWHDIHRIKHKKDRDRHPCQLPVKLMNRIIELTTDENDWVYDPFGGAGTTALAARLTRRNFVITEIDSEYVKVARASLSQVRVDTDGNRYIERKSVPRRRSDFSKKEIETAFLTICREKGRVVDLGELETIDSGLHSMIVSKYKDYKRLAKIARRSDVRSP